MPFQSDKITYSIVSHGQSTLIHSLLLDLENLPQKNFEVFITINLPENEAIYKGFSFPLNIIWNDTPKGFGNNHNNAFAQSNGKWFAVVNPDIRINILNLNDLLSPFRNESVAVVAPLVVDSNGNVEDSARRYPTLLRFMMRVLLRQRGLEYKIKSIPYSVDWVAGMFIVFRRTAYQQVDGFDALRFFMYLEDADICRRLSKEGWKIVVNPSVRVTHMAQRASRHNLKHMYWHIISALRFLTNF